MFPECFVQPWCCWRVRQLQELAVGWQSNKAAIQGSVCMSSKSTGADFQAADEALKQANSLVRAQEAAIARMLAAGIPTERAKALLAAYEYAARLAVERQKESD